MITEFLHDFIQVNIGSLELSANHRVRQVVDVCTEFEKRDLLLKRLERIMQDGEQKTIIFTQTKRTADDITRALRQDGWPALGKLRVP